MIHQELTEQILGAAIEVHRILGPGLLESAYQACLAREFALQALAFEREVAVPIEYKGVRLDCGYRIDFVVARKVVVELKAVELITPVHEAQLLTYLRLTGARVGLLLNFHEATLANGVVRRVL